MSLRRLARGLAEPWHQVTDVSMGLRRLPGDLRVILPEAGSRLDPPRIFSHRLRDPDCPAGDQPDVDQPEQQQRHQLDAVI
jgi:hypothetical protein